MKTIFTLIVALSISKAYADMVSADVSYSMTFQPMCSVSSDLNFGSVNVNPTTVAVGSTISTATLLIQCDAGIPVKFTTDDNSGSLDIEMNLGASKAVYSNMIDLKFKSKSQAIKKATPDSNEWVWGNTSGTSEVIEFSAVFNNNYAGQAVQDFKKGYSFKLNKGSKNLNIVF